MFKDLKNLYHKELFLYGFFISYFAGTLLATLLAFFLHEYINMLVTFIAAIMTYVTYVVYAKTKNYALASLALLWNASIVVFIHIVINKYSIDIAFTLLIPMAASLLLHKKQLLLHGGLYLFIIILLFIYGFWLYPEHPFLHNPNLLVSYFMLAFFVIAFGATYHFAIEQSYKKLELSNTELKASNKEKSFLLKEVHHRVKNNLNMMTSILGLQENQYHGEEINHFIKQNALRIKSMALVHELLYQNENLEHIDFASYVKTLVAYIFSNAPQNDIEVDIDIKEPLVLDINDIIHLGIILNELITNSMKYAFPTNKGNIFIGLEHTQETYTLTYKDDGVGISNSKNNQGFGLNLIALSTEQLEGALNIKSSQGFVCTIRFKGNTP